MENYCTQCGSKLAPGSRFCSNCGAPVTGEREASFDALSQSNGTKDGRVDFSRFPSYKVGTGKTLREKYFSTKGRLNRKRYFLRSLALAGMTFLICVAIFMIMFCLVFQMADNHVSLPQLLFTSVIPLIGMLLFAVPQVSSIMLAIRRSHDLGKSGEYVLWSFIPLAGLYFAFHLVFVKGTTGPNEYGPDPLQKE
jgi:uncharacterized membrane protein YhaH (DUF805 family)